MLHAVGGVNMMFIFVGIFLVAGEPSDCTYLRSSWVSFDG
jgi:hypothetical protein